jgi:hypothetical protein
MVSIKRIWLKDSHISNLTESLDIWDSGSHLYERWPDGTEQYWKVIERKEVEGGVEEHLKKMPVWESPSQVLHLTQVQVLKHSENEFLVKGWKITQMPFSPLINTTYKADNKKHIIHLKNQRDAPVKQGFSEPQLKKHSGRHAQQSNRRMK